MWQLEAYIFSTNYREVFEKLFNYRLRSYFSNFDEITACQYGFRNKRSAFDAILEDTEQIVENFKDKSAQHNWSKNHNGKMRMLYQLNLFFWCHTSEIINIALGIKIPYRKLKHSSIVNHKVQSCAFCCFYCIELICQASVGMIKFELIADDCALYTTTKTRNH